MRNQFRLVALFGGATLFAGVTAAMLVACTGDDTVVGLDASTPDGGPGADSGKEKDAAVEAASEDGGLTDAGVDGADASADGGFDVLSFDVRLATQLCESLARCCYGNSTPADGGADGGTFDQAACIAKYTPLGWESSNADSALKTKGKIAIDRQAGDSCLAKAKAMSCNLPGTEFKAIRDACFGVYVGLVEPGGNCTQSIECKPDNFCKQASDGGVGPGVCTALVPLEGSCGNVTAKDRSDEVCSYRAGATNSAFCETYSPADGLPIPVGQQKCKAARPLGAPCQFSIWCNNGICPETEPYVCKSPEVYWGTSCGAFRN